jgi:hypothetical protein
VVERIGNVAEKMEKIEARRNGSLNFRGGLSSKNVPLLGLESEHDQFGSFSSETKTDDLSISKTTQVSV